ncbi:glutaredoxin-like protein, putative [Trypanosoma brucei gambiense DAL972]|uniref:Glutaredoxin-like protein, putative n=1 Tax=Trypanosoma brucei gambiense (strain MHOM/CI/86/DAL972) TaxID=679716 RepID=C9ZXG5_TRYB9|nr:glutaredoxin-like protein, putative [Trypanosoma brucei gambiense DAL972]CBH14109.1 glutaredoxin-like protein, putative [Trypanosoma brucei gambiense DAL972]|eukprot:XP_011776380.1 glutaredoxin-like protein, putative [Trypanosoma brucei gambiense DAL972]
MRHCHMSFAYCFCPFSAHRSASSQGYTRLMRRLSGSTCLLTGVTRAGRWLPTTAPCLSLCSFLTASRRKQSTSGIGGDVRDIEETHPDFQPRLVSADLAEDEIAMVKKDIDDTIKSEDVVTFIKGLPEAPMCAYSKRMIDVLEALGLEYTSFDVLAHPVVRSYVKEVSEWPTIPQLFIKAEFVGGLDIVTKMLESGDLKKMLRDKGITCRDL